eukprot:5941209-Pyramimonas_sp.AAC.3
MPPSAPLRGRNRRTACECEVVSVARARFAKAGSCVLSKVHAGVSWYRPKSTPVLASTDQGPHWC